tara:strand:- start:22 stop:570 length:549 start_codon:yes stop_codon:yes gene_type:complete
MLRDYETGTKDDVKVFAGLEVEHTPAFGKQTLFLARNDLTTEQIQELAVQANAEAIYFGANRTFMYNHGTQIAQMMKFLDDGYYVTIDYPYSLHDEVKKRFSKVWTREKFIPFCSIIFENSEEDNNLCFKIDDIDFNKTNPGVWTMSMNEFKQSSGFTSWKDYKKDKPIKEDKWLMRIPHTQ